MLPWPVDPAYSSQNLSSLLVNINKLILKFMWTCKAPLEPEQPWKGTMRTYTSQFQNCLPTAVIRTMVLSREPTCRVRGPWVMVDWHLTSMLRALFRGNTSVFREQCPGNSCPHPTHNKHKRKHKSCKINRKYRCVNKILEMKTIKRGKKLVN